MKAERVKPLGNRLLELLAIVAGIAVLLFVAPALLLLAAAIGVMAHHTR